MMETWPSYARILSSGFSEKPDFGVVRADTDGALAKQRPRYSTGVTARECKVLFLTLAERNAFQEWIKNSINRGADFFNWPDPLDGNAVKMARIVSGTVTYSPEGRSTHSATFTLETIG